MAIADLFRRKSQNLSMVIESIYGLRVKGDTDKSLEMASEAFTHLVEIDLQSVLKLEATDFAAQVCEFNYTVSYVEILVKFLIETAAIFTDLKQTENAENLQLKTLYLLKTLVEKDKTYSTERDHLIQRLENKFKV